MGCRSGMYCYVCGVQLPNPKHFAFDEEGDVLVMCNDCYDDISKFYVKGVNANESKPRRVNKGD